MKIYGLQKTTLLDYPGHVAATLFTGGCNMRCPFCQNSGLVLHPEEETAMDTGEVLAFLKKRQGILDGVCITGGEPTLQPDLEDFIRQVKALGYLVKLDTNGYRPRVLEQLLQEKLLDYVAMDIKASKENYGSATGCDTLELAKIEQSVELLKTAGIPYEFRTTVVKGIHRVEEFHAIGAWLQGVKAYFLQNYRDSEQVMKPGFAPFDKEELEQMKSIAEKYVENVFIRGEE